LVWAKKWLKEKGFLAEIWLLVGFHFFRLEIVDQSRDIIISDNGAKMSKEKQLIIDVYEFENGFLTETSVTDPKNNQDSNKRIVKTLDDVVELMQREYINFSLEGK